MSISTFDQFAALQNALTELNYSQPLLRESVPLVQAIFTDLIEVTKKYTQIRKQSERTENELRSQIDPLKVENDKLTKSNNELHLKIIKNSDSFQADLKAMERECEKLKLAKNELNVLLNQKKHKIKNQEMTINGLKKKMNAVLSAHGSNHKKLIAKSSKISFSANPLSPASSKNGSASDEMESKETMDDDHEKYLLLQQENAALLAQLREITASGDDDKQTVAALEEKLRVREQELQRIHDTLSIDEHRIKFLQIEQQKDSESQRIRHLESQIEVLQSEVAEKEAATDAVAAKDSAIERLKAENRDLADQLEATWKELDRLKVDMAAVQQTSKALKLEKKFDVLRATKKMSKNVSEGTLMRNKIEELTKCNKVLETKLANKTKAHSVLQEKAKEGVSTNHTANVALEMKEKELQRLRADHVELMKVAEDLKNRLKALRHEMELNRNERSNLELSLKATESKLESAGQDGEAMAEKYDSLRAAHSKQQDATKEAEEERDSLRFKLKAMEREQHAMDERLRAVMAQKHDFEKSGNRKQSENFELAKQLQHEQFKNEDLRKDREWNEKSMLGKVAKISQLEQEKKELLLKIERINEELDGVKLKCKEIEFKYSAQIKATEALEDRLSESEEMLSSLKGIRARNEATSKSNNELEMELVRIRNDNDRLQSEAKILENGDRRKAAIIKKIDREKNDLKLILQQMQHRIIALQQRLTSLSADRDHLKATYDAAAAAMDHKNEVIESGTLSLNDLKAENAKLRRELDALTQRAQELQTKCDAKERVAAEGAAAMEQFERIQEGLNRNLRTELDEKKQLQHQLRQMAKERDALREKYDEMRAEHSNLTESVVPSLTQQVVVAQVESGELKVLCNKLDDGQKGQQMEIEELLTKNQALGQQLEGLRAENAKTVESAQREQQLQHNLKQALQKLVDKHDALQNELDAAAEREEAARCEVAAAMHRNEELQSILGENQQQFRCQQQQLREMEQKQLATEQQLAVLQREVVPRLKEEGQLKGEQLRQCQQDIENVTKENQFLNNEYAVTVADRDTKQKQLANAVNKVMALEAQCKNGHLERTQILENYQSVALENEKLQRISEQLDRGQAEYAVKIAALEEHIRRRDHRIKDLEKLMTECNLSNHELQRQCQSLTRDLERSNLNNSKNQTLSSNLQQDLEAMRSNVVQKQHKDLERKTAIILEFKKENKNLQGIVTELNLEKQAALDSLQSAEQKMASLEGIIQKLRVDHIANNEHSKKDADEASKLKRELNSMRDLNDRLSQQLGKMAS